MSNSNLPQQSHNKISGIIQEIEKLPKEEQRKLFGMIHVESHYSGPIPPVDIIQGYETLLPGSAQRILAMSEKQQEHRLALEKSTIAKQMEQSGRGQRFGLVIGLSGIVLTGRVAYLGHSTTAAIIGVVDIVGLVSIFVIGKNK